MTDGQPKTDSTNENIDSIVNEAEERFREGVKMLDEWGSQAREIIQRQPVAVLAGVAVLGFLSGVLLRRAVTPEKSLND